MGNKEAVQILCDANINPNVKLLPGTGAFKIACGFADVPTIQAIMTRLPVTWTWILMPKNVFFFVF